MNTYRTVPSIWSTEQLQLAKSIDVVTFASPSAVKTWVERVDNSAIAVCIGPTSERAAIKAGFKQVFSPDVGSKGIGPWASLIKDVALDLVE